MSGTPAGTKLKGLNYIKNKSEVFAMEDHEYPDWLWGLLDEVNSKSKADGGLDVTSKFYDIAYPMHLYSHVRFNISF